MPLTVEDIDAISGATVTTEAVVAAINKAYEEKNIVAAALPEGTRYTASEKGFAGPVAVFVTAKDDGTITALSIGDDQFKETEGFGLAALDASFSKQFVGKTIPLSLGDIDAISGATLTSEAVVNGINRAFEEKLVDDSAPVPEAAEKPAEAPVATEAPAVTDAPVIESDAKVYSASVEGYKSPVAVILTLDAEGKIASLEVGDDQFAETEGLGSKAKDEAFTSQFIGKAVPMTYNDIDMITAATITSEAVVDAINKAVKSVEEEQPAEAPAAEGETKVYTASVDGFKSPVAVSLTLDAEGKIATLVVGDDQFAETEGLGSKAKDEAFTSQFIGKAVPMKYNDIDMITAATVTSEAVVDAINKAVKSVEEEQPAEAPAAEGDAQVYTASVDGFKSPVAVSLTLDTEGKIASLVVGDDQFAETEGLGSKAKDESFTSQFIGKAVPMTYNDVDMITAATVTSEAVVDAINKAVAELSAEVDQAQPRQTSASVKGFRSPVAVTLTLDSDNSITALTIGDDAFDETEGLGSLVKEEAFIKQFIGKKAPIQAADVDMISGATETSEAVIEAINEAAAKLSN